jgi:hypothetical protein
MSLYLRNRKFYSYAFIAVVSGTLGVWFPLIGRGFDNAFLGVVTAIAGFFAFLYKQHLDETKLFKELFVEFNRRYDRLNNRLNQIVDGDSRVELKPDEKNTLFDYFNLCAEEHFFKQSGYIDETVWNAWRHGMAFFFNNPRIRELWNQECASADERASYYKFEPPAYAGPAEGSSISPLVQRTRHQATWQAAEDRAEPRSMQFLVSQHFAHAPQRSVAWAQQFVDVALSYQEVRAFPNDAGVGFDPNFVFIERVYTEEEGFAASFYGGPDEFAKYGHRLKPGRSNSYSRLKVYSADSLGIAEKCLHISANLQSLESKT